MAVMCALKYKRIKQVEAYTFLILPAEKEDAKKKTEKETAIDVKKKEPGKAPEAKQGTTKVAAQAAKKDEKKEDSKKTKNLQKNSPREKVRKCMPSLFVYTVSLYYYYWSAAVVRPAVLNLPFLGFMHVDSVEFLLE
uniref:Uncharacterized protein LOC109701156 isoform X2 n=1 Tax=Castor canadensis TaxID=51338 RepID=A0A8B7WFJ8_CASCN|nr:uncharacterized protein LOC109701156 isoform X2 [Castor canadensis]